MVMRDYLSDEEVVEFFRVTSQNGLKLVRIFAFVNGKLQPLLKYIIVNIIILMYKYFCITTSTLCFLEW